MTTKRLIISAVVLSAVSYGIGNYTGKLTSSVEDTSKSKEKDKERIVIIERPGEKRTEIIREREKNTSESHKETAQTEKSRKTNISAIISMDVDNTVKPIYGISVTREIIGPFTAGAFGLNNGIIGLSVGMSF